MFGFGKKHPLFDQVRRSDIQKTIRIMEAGRGRQHEAALSLLIGSLIEDMASHMVKEGPPKNFGKVINADVFTFEVLAYTATILERAVDGLADFTTDYFEEEYATAMGMIAAQADKLCGWQTKPVMIARFDEYNQPGASGMNLISTLMTVGDAAYPMIEYLRPLDFQSDDRKLQGQAVALTGIRENYATTLLAAIEEYGLDPY